jgi:hypothetical protein
MNGDNAAAYIWENFQSTDRLAVVLLNKRTASVIQRLATAEKIAAEDFQAWLQYQNGRRHEVYISMNALREEARGRTKGDVAAIRHLYLDFDDNGTAAMEATLKRTDLPRPSYVISTSPGKWQVTWKVEGFGKEEAETFQRSMAGDSGADPAATDCARVLRLPGFYNHKYSRPHLVRAERLAGDTYRPEHFPKLAAVDRAAPAAMERGSGAGTRRRHAGRPLSQSERDWAFAKRALSRGESPALVAATIASYRRYDKHNPQYYGELTVKKAAEALKTQETWVVSEGPERT